jgi:hypothetical protein
MNRWMRCVCALALLAGFPGLAQAGEVRLAIKDGRVDLMARDATLREILVEWERVGGTRIVNRDRVPGTRLNLDLSAVTEDQALTTLLRPIAGYMASRRIGPEGGASAFSRIVLMTAAATPVSYPAAGTVLSAAPSGTGTQPGGGGPPFGRPGMQRRVLPDGRVVTVMDEPDRGGDPDDRDEATPAGNQPGMMRPPFGAPPRQQDQGEGDTPRPPSQPGQAVPTTTAMPMVPAVTVATPGALPAAKPGATPPAPIKPPGD